MHTLRRIWYYLPVYLALREHCVSWLRVATAHAFRRPLGSVRLRSGVVITHPASHRGLADTILEIWVKQAYFKPGWYTPAPDHLIIDAGANVGLFSLWVLESQPRALAVAIEPGPDNLQHLRANLSIHKAQVRVIAAALAGRAGRGFLDEGHGRSVDHRLADAGTSVELRTLEDVIDEVAPGGETIQLLKMDIEGGEADVLEALPESHLRRIQRIALEFHDNVVPGSLARVRHRLGQTHHIELLEHDPLGYGLLWCERMLAEPS